MPNEVTKQDQAPQDRFTNPDVIKAIKGTVCQSASDAQLFMFLEICRRTGLDPFLKEIWFVPGVGVMAARDGYLRVANENPMFDGIETRVERDSKNIPIKAICTVWRKDRAHPTIAEAYYNEYRKSGKVWDTYPSAMISKVAEVLALKRSFSINGVVTEEDIGEQHPTGSKEAAAELGKAKVKALAAGAPREMAEHIAEAETEDIPKAPPTAADQAAADAMLATDAKWIGDMMQAFSDIKAGLLGETEYYAILQDAGCANKAELMKKGRAECKRVYKIMGNRLIAIKREIADKELEEALGV